MVRDAEHIEKFTVATVIHTKNIDDTPTCVSPPAAASVNCVKTAVIDAKITDTTTTDIDNAGLDPIININNANNNSMHRL